MTMSDQGSGGLRCGRPRSQWLGTAAIIVIAIAIVVACARRDNTLGVATTTPPPVTGSGESTGKSPTSIPNSTPTFASASSVPPRATTSASWAVLPESPLAPRSGHSVVWTGSEMIVWGGSSIDGDWTDYGDGAAFDPAAGKWRSIAPAPIVGRQTHSAVWTGSEMVVWGGLLNSGCGTAAADGAAYDPATNRWRTIAAANVQPRWAHSAVWTGTEMIVLGGSPSGGSPSASSGVDGSTLCDPPAQRAPKLLASAYNPASDSWRSLASAPWDTNVLVDAVVWDGHEVLVWGGQRTGAEAIANPWASAGFSYDPAVDGWDQLPVAPLSARARFARAWTGRELVIAGGQDDTGNRSDVAAYDPRFKKWRPLADLPEPWALASTVWTGNQLIVVGGCCATSTNAASYDPGRDQWIRLPHLPFVDCDPGQCTRLLPAPVWTGGTAIVWGGIEEDGDGGGAVFRANGAGLELNH